MTISARKTQALKQRAEKEKKTDIMLDKGKIKRTMKQELTVIYSVYQAN